MICNSVLDSCESEGDVAADNSPSTDDVRADYNDKRARYCDGAEHSSTTKMKSKPQILKKEQHGLTKTSELPSIVKDRLCVHVAKDDQEMRSESQ